MWGCWRFFFYLHENVPLFMFLKWNFHFHFYCLRKWNWASGKVTFLIQIRLVRFLIKKKKKVLKKDKKDEVLDSALISIFPDLNFLGGQGGSGLVFYQTVSTLFSLINSRFCLHFCGIFHPKGLTALHLLSIWSVFTLYWSTAATVSGAQIGNVFNCV